MNVALGRALRLAGISLIASIGQVLGSEGCIPIKQYEPAASEGGSPGEGGAPAGGDAGPAGVGAEGGLGGEPSTGGVAGTAGAGGEASAPGGGDPGGAGAGGSSSDCPPNQYRDDNGDCLMCPTTAGPPIDCSVTVVRFDASVPSLTFYFEHAFYGMREGTTTIAFPSNGTVQSFPYVPDGAGFTVTGVPPAFTSFSVESFEQVDECGLTHTFGNANFRESDSIPDQWDCSQ